ncbi:MAG: helix-turn-helix domain-containing protein [Alphaproteobacteria bacterium]|nr:MAG: hypothetical protein B6I23_01695 [Rickettsiaceae bacterium 4572_127]
MNTRTESTIDRYIGERIKFFRKNSRMSQKQLAGEIGVSFQQLQKYESGENRITAGRLYKVSKILEISMEVFCDKKEEEKIFINDIQTTRFLRSYYKLQPQSKITLLSFIESF